MWEIGLSTGIGYQKPIEVVLPAVHEHGFCNIEVATAPSHVDPSDHGRCQQLAQTVERFGLRVCSLHAPFGQGIDLTDGDEKVRQWSLRRYREAADLLATLGGRLYVMHPGGEDHGWVWEREARLRRSVEGLAKIWQICRDRGLTLVIETPLPHLLGGHLDDFDWILRQVPEEGTGVCIDTSHTSLGKSLFEAMERFAERIVHIQASDNRGTHDDHLPPGEGIIDWSTLLKVAERIAYRGVFLFEINGRDDTRESVGRVKSAISRYASWWRPVVTRGADRNETTVRAPARSGKSDK